MADFKYKYVVQISDFNDHQIDLIGFKRIDVLVKLIVTRITLSLPKQDKYKAFTKKQADKHLILLFYAWEKKDEKRKEMAHLV